MRLIKAFIASFMPGVIKPLHSLWNELLAFLFLTLAGAFGHQLYKACRAPNSEPVNIAVFLSSGFLTALMLGLGIYSYRRARKISRS